MRLAARTDSLSPQGIDRAFAACVADGEILRLHHFETDLRPPSSALTVTQQALEWVTANTYLPSIGQAEFRSAISHELHRRSGHAYDPEREIVVTAGGLEAVTCALLGTVDPGAEVVVLDPTYTGLLNRIRLAGGTPSFVPFTALDGAWRLDLDRLAQAVNPRTQAMLVANPSMPTGAVLTAREWSAIVAICRERDLWLIYDGAMESIVYDGRPLLHPLMVDGAHERTFVIGSMAKEYSMVGWRLGWLAGPQAYMDLITRVATGMGSGAPGISQAAGAAVLTAGGYVADAVAVYQERRDVISEQLAPFGVIPAAGGWSCALDVSQFGLTSGAAVARLMERGKMAATSLKLSGREYGESLVRLAFGAESATRLARVRSAVEMALS